jgi:hypothetical protein
MKQIIAAPLLALMLATPALAQDEPSLMERGAKQFFEGLMQEMAPALDELTQLMEEAGPALQSFMAQMGPKLGAVLEEVEDWSLYEAPEVQPNGDIIIRRKPEAPAVTPEEEMPQIEL